MEFRRADRQRSRSTGASEHASRNSSPEKHRIAGQDEETRALRGPFADILGPRAEDACDLAVGQRRLEGGSFSIALREFLRACWTHGVDRHRQVAWADEDHIELLRSPQWRRHWRALGGFDLDRDDHFVVGLGEIFEDAVAVSGGASGPDAAFAWLLRGLDGRERLRCGGDARGAACLALRCRVRPLLPLAVARHARYRRDVMDI